MPYQYHAKPVSVTDGDTFTLDIDLGFHLTNRERVRLLGIDTNEIHFVKEGSEEWNKGMAQKDFTRKWFAEAESSDVTWPLTISTQKGRGKYGRFLADVTRKADGEILSEALVEEFGEEILYG